MELFTKVVDDAGTENYETYEPKSTDVEDKTFYEDERYKTVSDRDAKRRIRHTKVMDQVTELGFVVDDEGNVAAKEVEKVEDQITPAPQKIPTPDELYTDFKSRMVKEQKDEEDAKTTLSQQVDLLMTEHKLEGDVFRSILTISNDPEQSAKDLGKANLKFDNTNDGDNSNNDDGMTSIVADFRTKMGLDK